MEDYGDIYQQNLIFMAESEAGIYVKVNSLNGDSVWEIDGEELKQKLNKAEEDLKDIISVYEMINREKNKIINDLSPFVKEGNDRIKSIINGIETGEFSLS